MDPNTARRILGVGANLSSPAIKAASRRLLQALHPDKHPADQEAIFARLTRDVIEAAECLENEMRSSMDRPEDSSDSIIDEVLFYDSRTGAPTAESDGQGLVIYERCYAADKMLAVAVLSIDQASWATKPLFGGQPESLQGSRLNIRIVNRADKPISDFFIDQHSYLVDDLFHQYSIQSSGFYWTGSDGRWNTHSGFIVPSSRAEGFLLYPRLRPEAKRFVRWFVDAKFSVGPDWHHGYYDVQLV